MPGFLDPVTPRDCVFAAGIPLTEEGYEKSFRNGRSYAAVFNRHKHKQGVPPSPGGRYTEAYRDEVIAPVLARLGEFAALGATIDTALSLGGLRAHLSGPARVVIVMTHWAHAPAQAAAMEFSDGLRPSAEVGAVLAQARFSGCLDFVACDTSGAIGEWVVAAGEDCALEFRTADAYPGVWLAFYLGLFRSLARQPETFGVAFNTQWKLWVRAARDLGAEQ